MRKNKMIIALSTLLLSAFTIGLATQKQTVRNVNADGWEVTNIKAVPHISLYMYDHSDAYLQIKMSGNDYGNMSNNHIHFGTTTYYNINDYNFLSYIGFSDDNENFIPLSDLYNSQNLVYAYKDGKFQVGMRRTSDTEIDCNHQYIRILEGCEFPSYEYCANGGTPKKYVQQETVLGKKSRFVDGTTYGYSMFSEYVPPKPVTYTGIAPGWNNANYGTGGYNELIIMFGEPEVDYLANDHNRDTTNQATTAFDIGNKLTINGLSIAKIHDCYSDTKVGYDHGYCYFYVHYPTDILLMNKNNMVPTLHIEAGAQFMDSLLPELTLKLSGTGWVQCDADEMQLENPVDIDDHLIVELPHNFGIDTPHPVFIQLPETGVELAYTLTTGELPPVEIDPETGEVFNNHAINFDGLYNCTISVYPNLGAFQLLDKGTGEVVNEFYGYMFAPHSSYTFEVKVVCGVSTTFTVAVNHLIVINHTFDGNRSGACDVWSIDTSGEMGIDYYRELGEYKPTINYGGSAYYNFIEGDPVYNFPSIVNGFNLYAENPSEVLVETFYEDGAVTDGRYNAGNWTLTIVLTVEGYEPITKVINIRVHGKESIAKIYYDDGDPIEVPIGVKLTPPANPNTYREGDYDYVFDGWYFEGAKWDFENDVVQGDMHLYSRFKQTTAHYIVTVNFEGVVKPSTTYSIVRGGNLPFDLFELEGTTFEVYNGDTQITSLVVNDDVTITVKYIVSYIYVEAKEATCTEDGNVAYWYSPIYPGYYFGDSRGRELIKNVAIPKLNHHIVHLDYKDSSCHEIGNVECYYCENCHNHYQDSEGQILLENWAIEKKPHILTHHSGVSATCERDGNVEYWTCANEPGVYYADEACTETLESIVIHALGHDYRAPTYTWREYGDGYMCIAKISCTHCGQEITEAVIATETIVREASCSREGQISYFVRFANDLFNSQNKIVSLKKTPHTYVYVEEVKATKNRDGIKAHYECSECHKYFVKRGTTYVEVQYIDLFYKYQPSSSGCGGNITTSSILAVTAAAILSTLLVLKKKEEK